MLYVNFIFRHILRHWGMNLAVLLGLSIGAGLLGSLPAFAAATAARSLELSVASSLPSERNIQVTGLPQFLSAALNRFIADEIEPIISERVSVSSLQLQALRTPSSDEEDDERKVDGIWVWSIDKISQHSILLDGEWPVFTPPRTQIEALQPPVIQAAISEAAARELNLSIGDQLQDVNEFKYLITSIISITDPQEDIWWGDNSPFQITVKPGLNEDTLIVPILVNPNSYRNLFPLTIIEWRYIIDVDKVTIDNLESLDAQLTRIQNQISRNRAQLNTGLVQLINEHLQDFSTARMVLFLLSSQAFLVVIFTLILMAALLVNNSQSELIILKGRGTNRLQIIIAFGLQILILALIAGLVIGPLFSRIGLAIWSSVSGESLPELLPSDSWRMSLLAAGFGWFAILAAIIPATRITLMEWQKSITRPGPTTSWQTTNVDIFLLIIGGLLYWQLSNSGSFVMRRIQGTSFADPLLLIGPSLLLIALAMVSMRLLPFLLAGLGRLAKVGRGAFFSISLNRIARSPQRLNWVILLICLTGALTLFSNIYSDALQSTQQQLAVYQAGSNLRLDLTSLTEEEILNFANEAAISRVARLRAQQASGRGITILAVDPDSFANVAEYPRGLSNLTIEIIMEALSESNGSRTPIAADQGDLQTPQAKDPIEPVPAILSYSLIPKDGQVGDQKEITLAGAPVKFKIRGMIADFPTLFGDFIIVDRTALENIFAAASSELNTSYEAWLLTTKKSHQKLVSSISNPDAILADSQAILENIRGNIFTMGTTRAFALNALILVIISLSSLVLASIFSYRQRAREFNLLNAIGFSRTQTNRLLIIEACLVLALGLSAGFVFGLGLSRLMQPYISLAVEKTLPGMVVHQISLNWWNMAATMMILIIMYALVNFVLIFYLRSSKLQQTLRMGDE